MIHHDFNHDGNELAEQIGAVSNLVAIDRTVPRGAAMYQLIAKHVETRQDDRQYLQCIAACQCKLGSSPLFFEATLPLGRCQTSVVVLPKVGKHELVLQEHTDTVRELPPDEIAEVAAGIEFHQRA